MARTDGAPAARPAPTGQQPQRKIGKRIALVLGALLGLAVGLPLLVEFRIPLDALRGDIARHARQASGLTLRFEGPLTLVTGLRPGVEIHGLVVTGEDAQTPIEILRLGVGRGEIELWALLARELRLRSVRAEDLTLHLDPRAVAALTQAERRESARAPKASASASAWRFVDVTRLDVRSARLVMSTPAVRRLPDLVVDRMTLRAQAAAPLAIEAQGSFIGEPMQLYLRTASLAQLRGGARSLPVDFGLSLADASLQGSGAFEVDAQRGDYRISVKGHGRFLERVLPGFHAALGGVGDVSIEGSLRTTADATTLESVTLVAGRTRAQGELRQSVSNGRLRIRSRLEFETLDLRPWLPFIARNRQTGTAPPDGLDAIRAVQKAADVDFDLTVARLVWPEREAHDIEASLHLDPQAVVLAGSAQLLSGSIKLDARLQTAERDAQLRIDAQAGSIALEALHPEVVSAGLSGLVQSAKLDARAQGASMTALASSLEGTLELRKIDASWAPAKDAAATRIKIDRATLVATRDALQGSFAAAIDDARIALKLSGARAQVERAQRSLRSEFDLDMTRGRQRGGGFAARGTLAVDPQSWTLQADQLALGTSRGSLTAKGAWKAGAPLSIRASFDRFDVAALDFFDFESVQRRRRPVGWENRVGLPSALRLPAADFELSARQFDGAPLRVTDLRIEGRARDGRLEATRFALRAEGSALRGELRGDLRGRVPQLQGSVEGSDFDARILLEGLGLRLARATAKRLEAKFELRGARLKEVVAQSTLAISAQGVDATLPGLLEKRTLAFEGKLDMHSSKGQLRGLAEGSLNGTAFRATSRGPQLATLLARPERVPLDIELSAADSTLALQGSVAQGPTADLRIRLAAKRVDALLALLGVSTPVHGALSASAALKLTPGARVAFEGLDVKLGESHLAGHVVADWSRARPSIEAKLAGPTLRLRDLGIDASAAKRGPAKVEASPAGASNWLEPLRRFDGTLDLNVEQLFAAGAPMGRLKLGARLEAGRLRLAPLVMREAGSVLRAQGEIDARSATPSYSLQAELQRYDLTPLMRSFKLEAVGTASLDARTALRSRGVGEAAIANLAGTFDIASYGSDVAAGALASLGFGLLDLSLRRLDQASASKVNCAVGVFDVDRGMMKSRALFIDTTRLRLTGNLDVNLVTHRVDGGLRPHPKNPQLFAVNTPVDLSGTLEDPKVALSTSTLPGLVIRYSNPYTMFLGMLTDTRNAKPDGSDDCRAAYAKANEARPESRERGFEPLNFLPWN